MTLVPPRRQRCVDSPSLVHSGFAQELYMLLWQTFVLTGISLFAGKLRIFPMWRLTVFSFQQYCVLAVTSNIFSLSCSFHFKIFSYVKLNRQHLLNTYCISKPCAETSMNILLHPDSDGSYYQLHFTYAETEALTENSLISNSCKATVLSLTRTAWCQSCAHM